MGKNFRKKRSREKGNVIDQYLTNQFSRLLLVAVVITGALSLVIGKR